MGPAYAGQTVGISASDYGFGVAEAGLGQVTGGGHCFGHNPVRTASWQSQIVVEPFARLVFGTRFSRTQQGGRS
jgi:hypothetical protein